MKKLVYIAKNSDSIEDGQRPNCRLKISIIIVEDVIGRLTNYYISGPFTNTCYGGPDAKKSGS